jgi:hypothetical protein
VSVNELFALAIGAYLLFAFALVVLLERRADDGRVRVVEQALAIVMIAGALGAAGYVVARGVAALDRASVTVPGPTSGTASLVYSTSTSGGHAKTTDPPTSSDPTASSTGMSAHAITLAVGASTGPSSQVGSTDPTEILPELMVFVLVFAALGVLLMVGGVPRGRPPRGYRPPREY